MRQHQVEHDQVSISGALPPVRAAHRWPGSRQSPQRPGSRGNFDDLGSSSMMSIFYS